MVSNTLQWRHDVNTTVEFIVQIPEIPTRFHALACCILDSAVAAPLLPPLPLLFKCKMQRSGYFYTDDLWLIRVCGNSAEFCRNRNRYFTAD